LSDTGAIFLSVPWDKARGGEITRRREEQIHARYAYASRRREGGREGGREREEEEEEEEEVGNRRGEREAVEETDGTRGGKTETLNERIGGSKRGREREKGTGDKNPIISTGFASCRRG